MHLAADQSQFHFSINGADDLILEAFSSSNHQLAHDYEFVLQLLADMELNMQQIIGQYAVLTLESLTSPNFVNGIITDMQGPGLTPDSKQYSYVVTMQSPLCTLKNNACNRVFVNQSVPEVIASILAANHFSRGGDYQIITNNSYNNREMIVQHNESDYDFLLRQMQLAGLFFGFIQQANKAKLIITDDIASLPGYKTITYQVLTGANKPPETAFSLYADNNILTATTLVRDYNPNTPELDLKASVKTKQTIAFGTDYRYGEGLGNIEAAENLAKIRTQALDWQRFIITIQTDCPSLQPGAVIELTHCPKVKYNGSYKIIAIEHQGDQSDSQIYGKAKYGMTYSNKLLLIPRNITYRTPITKQPIINGTHSAIIENAKGEYAYLDEAGCYRIRLFSDLANQTPGAASKAIRLLQFYAGESYGSHFPLHAGTEIAYTFLNGDLNKPIILGVLPNLSCASPATSNNPYQNILRSWGGNELLMDDKKDASQIRLSSKDQQHYALLDATKNKHKIKLATEQGDMYLTSGKETIVRSDDSINHQVGDDHLVAVENANKIATKKQDVHLQAATDIKLKAKNSIKKEAKDQDISLKSRQDMLIDTSSLTAFTIRKKDLNIQAERGSLYIKAKKSVNINTQKKAPITIAQAGAKIVISKGGSISIKAKQINVLGQKTNIAGNNVQLGGVGSLADVLPVNKLKKIADIDKLHYSELSLAGAINNAQQVDHHHYGPIKLIGFYNDGRAKGLKTINRAYELKVADNTTQTGLLDNSGEQSLLQVEAGKCELTAANLEVIQLNAKKQAPWSKLEFIIPSFSQTKKKVADKDHTFNLTAIWPLLVKNYRIKNQANDKLTARDLHYFKTNGNNVTIFIHGFNVSVGYLCKQVDAISEVAGMPLALHTSEVDATTYRDINTLNQHFPKQRIDLSAKEQEELESELNGVGAYNWFLQMEDNLNRATGQFNRKDYSKYTRLLNISWPGDPGSAVDYMGAVKAAQCAGKRLVFLLKQLIGEKLEVNIIAHSLGNAVLLTALNDLGKHGFIDKIERVFLWEAAVPNDVLFPEGRTGDYEYDDYWYLPHAYAAVKNITVLYSENDNVLGAIPSGQEGQDEINKSKPIEELLPALLLSNLGLESLYELAMYVGVAVTDLLDAKLQGRIYSNWIKKCNYKRQDGSRFEFNLRGEITYLRCQHRYVEYYNRLKVRLEGCEGSINLALEKSGHPIYEKAMQLGEAVFEHLPQIIWLGRQICKNDKKIKIKLDKKLAQYHLDGALSLIIIILYESDIKVKPALGYSGPDKRSLAALHNKLSIVPQRKWLWSHSGMKTPSKALMQQVYVDAIYYAKNYKFGQYKKDH